MIDTLKLEEALQPMTWADKPYNAAYESPHYVRASACPSYMRRHWRGELAELLRQKKKHPAPNA